MKKKQEKEKIIQKVVRLELNPAGRNKQPMYDALAEIQQQVNVLKNKTIQVCWKWDGCVVEFQAKHNGATPEIKDYYPGQKREDGVAYDLYKNEFPNMYRMNFNCSIRQAYGAFDNHRGEMRRGEMSVISYRSNQPMELHNTSIVLWRAEDGTYELKVKVFSEAYSKKMGYRKENGRLDCEVPFKITGRLNDSQRSILQKCIEKEYSIGESKLMYQPKKGKWFLNLTYKFTSEKNEQLDPHKIMGVDLGIACVACMGFEHTPERCIIKGGEVEAFRRKTEERKKSLQEQGKYCGEGRIGHGYATRTKPLQKISDAIARFRGTANHKYSRYIVDMAVKHGCGVIQMEDLAGVGRNKEEKFLRDWTYFDLQTKIDYKAKEKGIEVRKVNPRYTSQRCSQCGYIHQDNRKVQEKFKCQRCGFEENADYNASLNLAKEGIEKIIIETLKAQKQEGEKPD